MSRLCLACGDKPPFTPKEIEKRLLCMHCVNKSRKAEALFVRCASCGAYEDPISIQKVAALWGKKLDPKKATPTLLLIEFCGFCSHGRPLETREVRFIHRS